MNGGPIGSSATIALTSDGRASAVTQPIGAPAEALMRIAGPILSSKAAPCSRSMAFAAAKSAGSQPAPAANWSTLGSSGSPLPGHWVWRWAVGCAIGPAAEFVISAETSSYGNRLPTGPRTSGWNGARPWPGLSTT